jgi:drug/metabolite transporter (DMT)-like permease
VNLAIIAGVIVFFVVVGKLGTHQGTIAIIALLLLVLLCTVLWPLFRLLRSKPSPGSAAFILYGAWIASFAYVAASFFVQSLPAPEVALLLGIVLMWAFFIAYRKVLFPSLFAGEFRKRWSIIRQAQRAEKEERESFINSLRSPDQK